MSFRKWLETEFNPFDDTEIGVSSTQIPNSTLARIEQALNPLDIPVEQGFSGTPDYTAPEQAGISYFSTSNPRSPDFYQILLKDLPNLFPNHEKIIKQMLDDWLLFKSELLRRIGKKQYMDSDRPRYPIHYALPLTTLRNATQAFGQVDRLLSRDKDPNLHNLKMLFGRLFTQHSRLQRAVENPLITWLKQARQNPEGYTNAGIRKPNNAA